jgi:hypothetical protein
MKFLIAAAALIVAAPALAQTPDPHAGHKPAEHEKHKHAGHEGGMDCCKDKNGNGKMDCCERAADGTLPDCCKQADKKAGHDQHSKH